MLQKASKGRLRFCLAVQGNAQAHRLNHHRSMYRSMLSWSDCRLSRYAPLINAPTDASDFENMQPVFPRATSESLMGPV
jgi:hypothetical protein